jgi:hypothetical protein
MKTPDIVYDEDVNHGFTTVDSFDWENYTRELDEDYDAVIFPHDKIGQKCSIYDSRTGKYKNAVIIDVDDSNDHVMYRLTVDESYTLWTSNVYPYNPFEKT